MGKLKVQLVKISNILGIENLEFSPDSAFTEISGGNGSGKTSALEAIRAAVTGGHDATLLRAGQSKGEIVLVLDDGTEIRKRVTEKGSYVDVVKDNRKAMQPANTIRALADLLSVNPIDFLRAPEKERVNVLMDSMPIEVDRARLQEISGIDMAKQHLQLNGLDLIEAVRQAMYDERTGLNRATREKQVTITQLEATLPDYAAEVADGTALREQVTALDAEKDEALLGVHQDKDARRGEHDKAVAGLRRQMADLQAQIDDEGVRLAADLGELNNRHHGLVTGFAEKRSILTSQLAAIDEAAKAQAKAEGTRQNIAQIKASCQGLEKQADDLTAALGALDTYKVSLLAALPVPGLEVVGGKVLRHGVPFDRLNTAQQVEVAVEIAKLRASDLGLICVDGLELLDPRAYEAFREQAEASGLQLIVSRVASGPLTVGAPASAPEVEMPPPARGAFSFDGLEAGSF